MSNEIIFTAAYTETDRQLVLKINAWLSQSGKTKASLSKSTGINEGTRSSILNGSYPSSPTQFLERMVAEIDRINARNQAARTEIPYTETDISKRIHMVCGRAHIDRDFGYFAGRVGVGKTQALKAYARKNQAAILIPVFQGIDHSTFINELIIKSGLVHSNGSISMQIAAIIRAFKGTDKVILIDEAEWLPARSFGALRRISDEAEIGVVLVGTPNLLPIVQDPDGRFGQISSRIGFWPSVVERVSESDCRLLVESYFSASVEDDVFKAFFACCEGSGRTLKNLLKNTYRNALRTGADITPAIIKQVNRDAMAGRCYGTGSM